MQDSSSISLKSGIFLGNHPIGQSTDAQLQEGERSKALAEADFLAYHNKWA
jgi:hypothetical protein